MTDNIDERKMETGTESATALLLCPTCGSQPEKEYKAGGVTVISCHNRMCGSEDYGFYTDEDAIAAWNRSKPVQPAAVEDCGHICGYQEPYGFVPEADCPVHDSAPAPPTEGIALPTDIPGGELSITLEAGTDTPWPFESCVKELIAATDILLHHNNHDGPRYEEMGIAMKTAQMYLDENDKHQRNRFENLTVELAAVRQERDAMAELLEYANHVSGVGWSMRRDEDYDEPHWDGDCIYGPIDSSDSALSIWQHMQEMYENRADKEANNAK